MPGLISKIGALKRRWNPLNSNTESPLCEYRLYDVTLELLRWKKRNHSAHPTQYSSTDTELTVTNGYARCPSRVLWSCIRESIKNGPIKAPYSSTLPTVLYCLFSGAFAFCLSSEKSPRSGLSECQTVLTGRSLGPFKTALHRNNVNISNSWRA